MGNNNDDSIHLSDDVATNKNIDPSPADQPESGWAGSSDLDVEEQENTIVPT